MNIAVIGTGYVGLVSGACLADFGHHVTCIDMDSARIAALRRGEMPFYEPGLAELVGRHAGSQRLRFTTDVAEGTRGAAVVFLAVGTPSTSSGHADLRQIENAVVELSALMAPGGIIATKSTVPVGTGAWIRGLLDARGLDGRVEVVSNPEFLREGSAIADFMRPDRVVIGTTSERAAAIMREIYRPLYLIETPLIVTTIETSEMIKYAANAFLAVKISFINEVANLCDRTGADVHVVAKGMGLDKRIGSKFLHPGPGFGGSCFPKDTRALVAIGQRHDVSMQVVAAAVAANQRQLDLTVDKVAAACGGLAGAVVGMLGLSFKPNTSDIRESPAWELCRRLIGAGAHVRAFDPAAMDEARADARDLPADQLTFAADALGAATGADAVVIATEWNEFRSIDLAGLRSVMRRPAIVDTRNVLEPARVAAAGFLYLSTGRDAAGALPQGHGGGTPLRLAEVGR